MTDPGAPEAHSSSVPVTGGGGRQTGPGPWSWLLPALTFLGGVALGGVVVGVGFAGGDSTPTQVTASPSTLAAPTTSPGANADVQVTVPGPCLDAADAAAQVARQLDEVANAAKNLDARRLQEIVNGFQQLQPKVQREAAQCRQLAGDRLQQGQLVTPVPSPTGTP